MLSKAKLTLPLLMIFSLPSQAENTSVHQLLQDVINHYPAIKTAYFQVAKAQQDSIKINAQFGWQLNASTGYAKEVSLFGSPVDQMTVAGSYGRQLKSGDKIALSASMAYEDSELSTIPSLPNPSTSSNLKLEYTKPLGKGAGNVDYTLELNNAKAAVDIKVADQRLLLDKMAQQVIDLYLNAINTSQRINNTQASIKRTKKLSEFIRDRLNLGIVEDKDQLQTDAQLENQKAQLSALKLAWTQQTIAINRLTGKSWDHQLKLSTPVKKYDALTQLNQQIEQVKKHSPALVQVNSLIAISENKISLQRQNQKDNLDLKLFVGNKTSSGDSTAGDVSNSDVVAGIQLSFSQNMDKSAENAALYQAQLERGLQLQNKKQLLEDLHYDLASLLAEASAVSASISAYKRSKAAEQKKLKDAEKRYRSGRIDIDQLLQFENQLSATELSLNLQRMELQKRLLKLSLLKGEIWQNIKLPIFDFENDENVIGDTL